MRFHLTRVLRAAACCLAICLGAGQAAAGVEVVCHRGANEHCPENTYAAARKCIEWGVAYEPRKKPDAFRQIVAAGVDMVNLNHGDLFLEIERAAQPK